MTTPFRFGLQISLDTDTYVEDAKAAEAAGFDVVTVADHIGPGLSPMLALSAIARETSTIRLGTFVINAEFRNPVQLAWEAATLDRLSDGRFELGIGAGHTPQEFAAIGMVKQPGRVRKERLMESVEIMRQLFDGKAVNHTSDFFDLRDASLDQPVQGRLPILVGGNGEALLRHAGAHADIIGLQGLGRTLEDGHRHTVNWSPEHLDAQVASVEAGAAQAGSSGAPGGAESTNGERNALVQILEISDGSDADTARLDDVRDGLLERVEGLTADHLAVTPYALMGTLDEVVAKIEACRERWGISYFVVRDCEAFAPVIERFRS